MPRLAFDVDDQFSQEFNELVQLTGASSEADAFRRAISLYRVVTKNEMENIIASVEKGYDYTLNNLDSTKTEEIISQIDLAQARISKDQEEIESLAKETDKLLNQLEDKAI